MKIYLSFLHTFRSHLFQLSKYRELIEFSLLSLISFTLPVFIGHPQIVVGIVVNALIVRTSLTMKGWKSIPTIMLPSLGAILRGVLFGTYTPYLALVMPFIWMGNAILSYYTKWFAKYGIMLSCFVPSILKASAIFIPTVVLVKMAFLPDIFLKSMGLTQLITAVAGSLFAIMVTQVEFKYLQNKS